MPLRQILLQAAKNTWAIKRFWFLGLLIMTPFIIQNEWLSLGSLISALSSPQEFYWFFPSLSADTGSGLTITNFFVTASSAPLDFIAFIAFVILLITISLFFAWIMVNAQAIVIYLSDPNKNNLSKNMSQGLNRVSALWLSLLELNLGLNLLKILSISLLLALWTFMAGSFFDDLWLVPVLLVGLVLMSVSYVVRFAIFNIIQERTKLTDSIKHGWQMFKKYYLECYEFSFILFIVNAFAFLFIQFILNAILPSNQFAEAMLSVLTIQRGWILFIIVGLIIATSFAALALLVMWQYASWLLWHEMALKQTEKFSYLKKLLNRFKK